MLMQARAEQFYLGFVTSSDTAREQMHEVFADTDTRLPPLERARLGARCSVFASPIVRGLYERLFAESWPVEVNPEWFRSMRPECGHWRGPRASWATWRRRSTANSAPTDGRVAGLNRGVDPNLGG
jgi:hypothetical protein